MSSYHSFEGGKDCVFENTFHNSTVGRPLCLEAGLTCRHDYGYRAQRAPSSPHTSVPVFPQV